MLASRAGTWVARGVAVLRRHDAAAAFASYLAFAVLCTWPLASDPSRLGVPNPDYYINTWVLAWVYHQLGTDPGRLFDANVFWPVATSLAYNEALLPQSLLAAPVRLLGGGPVLAHNAAFLATFPLSALGTYLLARELHGSRGGALLAGLGFGFCAFRFFWINNIQCSSTQWFPFVILLLLQTLQGTGRRPHLWLFMAALAQALSSGYFALLLPVVVTIVMLHGLRQRPPVRRVAVAAVALGLAAVGAVLAALPYLALSRRDGLERGVQELAHWSASLTSFVNPGTYYALPHHVWMRGIRAAGDPLYPGAAVLVLALVGVAQARRGPRAQLALALAVAGLWLALGPVIAAFGWSLPAAFELLRALPGGGMLRTPARLGILAILGIDLLAAAGWAWIVRVRPSLARAAIPLTLVAAVEMFPFGLHATYRPIPPVPPAARWLATAEPGPVLVLPWNEQNESSLYMYWSTAHWLPLVNGAGSFDAHGHQGLGLIGNRFPTPYSRNEFRNRGIVYVVVHADRLTPPQRRRLETALPVRGVTLLAQLGADRVYRIEKDQPGGAKPNDAARRAEPAPRPDGRLRP